MNDLMTKSFLSYVELQEQVEKDLEAQLEPERVQLNDADEKNLSGFFQEVNSIEEEMEEITNLLSDIETLNQESKSIHSMKLLRGQRDRIESDVVAVLRKAKIVKARIEALEKSNLANRKVSEYYREGSPVDRTRVLVTNGFRTKFREMMAEFQLLREKILSDYKDDLKRRYYTATGEEPSEEMMDKMVSAGEGAQIFNRTPDMDWKSKERHDAVMDIQRSLTRLHQVFLDMAVLVEKQGEKIDDIEENVVSACRYVSGGTNSLYYANQMKNRRASLCWICPVVLIILLVCTVSMFVN